MMKIVTHLLIFMSIALGFGSVYLDIHYVNTLPKVVNLNDGQKYPLNVHGTTVYLTSAEDSGLSYLQIGGLFFGICGGLLWKKCYR